MNPKPLQSHPGLEGSHTLCWKGGGAVRLISESLLCIFIAILSHFSVFPESHPHTETSTEKAAVAAEAAALSSSSSSSSSSVEQQQ